MYSKEEAKRLKERFWTNFGQFMSLVPNEEGVKVNWVNYKTGIKHLYFRMEADNKAANIYIEISHPDAGIRELMFSQFLTYKTILHAELDEEWIWHPEHYDEYGKNTARIGTQLDKKISVFKETDWPELIQFFKPRMIALDHFWSNAKYGFDMFK
ncbi:DUF4268 domain-containing protein [Sphingobacterium sp. FBM7-1]|uniref:DUF4268 domain-containing protein n=1 Tax=Sphingobacterium sp. FBM7-1 TaxID=2886688 RepID=UPI001D12636D|nr:DUF4268 domain-containing protein [Sphingobacterium sp. FBM7-1]MCC2597897.1 DUF4268 domain-containing protein [Sphingobacterium sp. FBM7-1]